VVKYRYAKLTDQKIPEAQFNGEPVRYRLCHVVKPLEVNDSLNRWLGETSSYPQGILTGTVHDQDTHTPIPDILISAGGQLTFTDANGKFFLAGLPSGVHNLVAYAINGSYETFQQGAEIYPNMSTPANIALQARPPVQVRFNVNAPSDAQGAPIYLAGNLAQLGNTFRELAGGMNLSPKKMPSLTLKEGGTYTIDLQLYAGTDLRYKSTLGDGFWNAERTSRGEIVTRQLIVPNQDIELDLQIASWRSNDMPQITFNILDVNAASFLDEIFIQFKTNEWTEPIPVWPLGGGNYLYILYSPLDEGDILGYRFCRNSNCQSAKSVESSWGEVQVQPEVTSVDVVIEGWEYWSPTSGETPGNSAISTPPESTTYSTFIELTPEMNPNWEIYAPVGFSTIADLNASAVILTPRWGIQEELGLLQPKLGSAPFHYQLTHLLSSAKSFHLQRGLFPQIETADSPEWQKTFGGSETQWVLWKESYQRYILNYAKISEKTKTEWLVIGGDALLPFYEDPHPADGSIPTLTDSNTQFWQNLITKVRSVYSGQVLWAAHLHKSMDPLPDFISLLDGIYLMVDSPLASTNTAAFDEIAWEFNNLMDTHIYEAYRSTGKPVYLALGYPAVDGGAQGCLLLNVDCVNDGLFLPGEIRDFAVDQEEQRLIYAALLPIVASRDWIAGTSIRGYQPTVNIQDGSSSIAGKPAMRLIEDWFKRINNP